jgi:hypothetical protein
MIARSEECDAKPPNATAGQSFPTHPLFYIAGLILTGRRKVLPAEDVRRGE